MLRSTNFLFLVFVRSFGFLFSTGSGFSQKGGNMPEGCRRRQRAHC